MLGKAIIPTMHILTKVSKGPMPLFDNERRLTTVLAGHPEDDEWSESRQEAATALESTRRERRIPPPPNKILRRRGQFATLRCRVPHGDGQKYRKNLKNSTTNVRITKRLNG